MKKRLQRSSSSLHHTIVGLSIGVAGFFAGSLYTMHMGVGQHHAHNMVQQVEEAVQRRMQDLQSAIVPPCPPQQQSPDERHLRSPSNPQRPGSSSSSSSSLLSIPPELSKFVVGATRTSKTDFFDYLDLGVPMDAEHDGDSQVLILHQRSRSLPTRFREYSEPIPFFETTQESLEHCDMLNVLLIDHSGQRNQCLAIVPQYESYVVQKYMRLENRRLSSDSPFKMVGRGMKDNGWDEFDSPTDRNMKVHMELLSSYFEALPQSLRELEPILKRIVGGDGGRSSKQKTITVMVSNFGQSELLVNFVCAARSRHLDISSIIVFATDAETKELAEQLGLAAFYDEKNFGDMPQEAAGQYGDRKFTAMMLAKVFCVHMVSSLNYNILFQDVDIVWYKNPIPFFETQHLNFDLLFQDDGGHSVRYAPYSANSGFYYVRANPKTKYFFHSLLMNGDLIQQTKSHQQALIALLTDHSSLFGLQTKVFSRDSWEFPGGYQYHQKSGQYMRDLFAGKIQPYIFHMSWTANKDNKLLFLRQMGEWYVQDQCVHQSVSLILGDEVAAGKEAAAGKDGKDRQDRYISSCCAAKPIISCHYRDKPSMIPCKDSPPIDAGRPSFWK